MLDSTLAGPSKDLAHVPLSNLVLRSCSGAELPLSSVMPITLTYSPGETFESSLRRAVAPWTLGVLGDV